VLLTAYRDLQRAVTDGRWKLIEYPKAKRFQLFNLHRDPNELRDLIDESRFADERSRMLSLLRNQQRVSADPLAP